VYSEYNEPNGLYFFYDDGQGGVRKIYEDGHSSNEDNEPAEFYTESDGAGGFRRIYQDSYYTRDDGQRIYTDGHESNDDDFSMHQDSYYTRDDGQRIYNDGHESNDDDPSALLITEGLSSIALRRRADIDDEDGVVLAQAIAIASPDEDASCNSEVGSEYDSEGKDDELPYRTCFKSSIVGSDFDPEGEDEELPCKGVFSRDY
jgi:hypothetical protein